MKRTIETAPRKCRVCRRELRTCNSQPCPTKRERKEMVNAPQCTACHRTQQDCNNDPCKEKRKGKYGTSYLKKRLTDHQDTDLKRQQAAQRMRNMRQRRVDEAHQARQQKLGELYLKLQQAPTSHQANAFYFVLSKNGDNITVTLSNLPPTIPPSLVCTFYFLL